jgi:CBS domain-containing protein
VYVCCFSPRDSFKRSFKRSGSTSRRSSFRKIDQTPSQEQINDTNTVESELRTSSHSLKPSNLNRIIDDQFVNHPLSTSINDDIQSANEKTVDNDIDDVVVVDNDDEDNDDDDNDSLIERIETEDGLVQDIRVYQIYLLGMSGTGKCSLMRQFKTTEYRGIYDYSSSLGRSMSFVIICSSKR